MVRMTCWWSDPMSEYTRQMSNVSDPECGMVCCCQTGWSGFCYWGTVSTTISREHGKLTAVRSENNWKRWINAFFCTYIYKGKSNCSKTDVKKFWLPKIQAVIKYLCYLYIYIIFLNMSWNLLTFLKIHFHPPYFDETTAEMFIFLPYGLFISYII